MYMVYGMSYNEFWYGKPELAVAYRKAHRLRMEQINQQLWMAGLYNHNAVLVAINNAFSKQKQKYIQEPIRIFPPTEGERKAQVEANNRKLVERLNAWKDAFEKSKGNQ